MPRLTRRVPSYRLHKPSGHAVVSLDGQDFYLGPHGTEASKAEYDRLRVTDSPTLIPRGETPVTAFAFSWAGGTYTWKASNLDASGQARRRPTGMPAKVTECSPAA